MYLDFFGFKEPPFRFNPDPRFLYLSPNHEEALRAVVCGVQQREGLMALVGETGTGKTMILRTALQWVSPDTKVAFITNFNLDFDELLHMILVELGLSKSTEAPSKVEAHCSLKEHAFQAASGGGRVVIILDEAQHLSEADLEKIRLLSNIETAEAKLLQILLCGQPELEAKIESTGMRQLKDRIAVRQHIQPLEKEQVREYVAHRLAFAGYSGNGLFGPESLGLICKYSRGVPRRVNILCHNSLQSACRAKQATVSASMVAESAGRLKMEDF